MASTNANWADIVSIFISAFEAPSMSQNDIEQQLAAIKVAVTSFGARAASEATSLKQERNARQAVSSLPDELLVVIFRHLRQLPTKKNPLSQ